jgi:diguanylate cyclase (GGDEF)-like protein
MEELKKPTEKEELERIESDLERTKNELNILYEISNAMRTTLELEEILYIILTGVTAHSGLGFNRASLFLFNEIEGMIEGEMGIGPETLEEASRIWKQIEEEKMDMDDLISAYKFSREALESGFNRQVRQMKIPLQEDNESLLAMATLEGMPLHLTKEKIDTHKNSPLIQLLKSEEIVLIPLKAKDKVNGIIVADNFITKKPITKDDLRMLIMLANQAGLAIENSRLYEKTVKQAHMDSLTGLWNQGYFRYLFQAELEKAKANKSTMSLIMLDIDDFKVYNDILGHQPGDKILKEMASVLKNQSRKMDYVCRYGGEEFAIILPQAEKKSAYMIAERLRTEIEKYVFPHEEILPNKRITVSLGLATYPEDGSISTELISTADKRLYDAKHKGKNTTCC